MVSIVENKETEYYRVPSWIEKAIKKLGKLKIQENELALQIEDYMKTHNIPMETPINLLKYFPEDDVHPNQIQMKFEKKE